MSTPCFVSPVSLPSASIEDSCGATQHENTEILVPIRFSSNADICSVKELDDVATNIYSIVRTACLHYVIEHT